MTEEQKKIQREYMREYRKRKPEKRHNFRKARENLWEVWEPGSIADNRAPRIVAALLGFTKPEGEAYILEHYSDAHWIDIDTTREFEQNFNRYKVPKIVKGVNDE